MMDIIPTEVSLRTETKSQSQKHSLPIEEETGMTKYARWGDSGRLPTEWRIKIEKSDIAAAAIERKVAMLYGQGMKYYKVEYDEKGEEVRRFFKDDKIERFVRKNKIHKFLAERLKNFMYFGILWSEGITSRDKKEIVSVRHLDSEMCRFHTRDETTGVIKMIGFSADFCNSEEPSDDLVTDIPLIDCYNEMESIRKVKTHKFAQVSKLDTPGRSYYPMPAWAGLLRKEGWLDVSNSIPETLICINDKQVKFRYIIRVAEAYWRFWYPEWDTYDAKAREEKVQLKKKELDDIVLNAKRMTVKSILTTNFMDPVTNQIIPGVEVIAVDDKLKNQEYIPNSQAADSKIVATLGIDPSEFGLQPEGGKMGGGSGSDKRTSRVNAVSISKIIEDLIFEPLYTVLEYNGWGDDVHFCFKHKVPTTLNENKSGIENLKT